MKKNLSVFLVVTLLMVSCIFSFYSFAEELKGDANMDGIVMAEDARLILRYSVGLEEFTEEQKKIADANGDGQITAADARIALRISVGLEDDSDKPTTDPDEPTTQPDEPTTENPLNTIGGLISPERAGLLYDKFGKLSTYNEIAEGEDYYLYTDGGLRQMLTKPYASGNEPTTMDLSTCQYCGKHVQPYDGEHFGSYYGYCDRYMQDVNCPECNVSVNANTCHTCEK